MSMRKIDLEIWREEFIVELDIFQRFLWIGLIVSVADDKGWIKRTKSGLPEDRLYEKKKCKSLRGKAVMDKVNSFLNK